MRQHAAADPVVELFKAIAAAVADVGVAVAAAVVEGGVACAPVVAVAAAGIAGLHAIAEVVVFQQGAVQARQIGHAAIEIVRQAVAGVPPDRAAVGTQPVAEGDIDIDRQHLIAPLLPGVFCQAVA